MTLLGFTWFRNQNIARHSKREISLRSPRRTCLRRQTCRNSSDWTGNCAKRQNLEARLIEFKFPSICYRYLITHVPSCVICSRFLFRSFVASFIFSPFFGVVVVLFFFCFLPLFFSRRKTGSPLSLPSSSRLASLLLVGHTSGNARPVPKSERE